MKHTPGPWSIRADLAITAYDAETEEHQPIARAFGDGSCENLFANSRLIAAAPDLLAALLHVMPHVGTNYSGKQRYDILKIARAAIAKATGE